MYIKTTHIKFKYIYIPDIFKFNMCMYVKLTHCLIFSLQYIHYCKHKKYQKYYKWL